MFVYSHLLLSTVRASVVQSYLITTLSIINAHPTYLIFSPHLARVFTLILGVFDRYLHYNPVGLLSSSAHLLVLITTGFAVDYFWPLLPPIFNCIWVNRLLLTLREGNPSPLARTENLRGANFLNTAGRAAERTAFSYFPLFLSQSILPGKGISFLLVR
jgi:hypothetical protein